MIQNLESARDFAEKVLHILNHESMSLEKRIRHPGETRELQQKVLKKIGPLLWRIVKLLFSLTLNGKKPSVKAIANKLAMWLINDRYSVLITQPSLGVDALMVSFRYHQHLTNDPSVVLRGSGFILDLTEEEGNGFYPIVLYPKIGYDFSDLIAKRVVDPDFIRSLNKELTVKVDGSHLHISYVKTGRENIIFIGFQHSTKCVLLRTEPSWSPKDSAKNLWEKFSQITQSGHLYPLDWENIVERIMRSEPATHQFEWISGGVAEHPSSSCYQGDNRKIPVIVPHNPDFLSKTARSRGVKLPQEVVEAAKSYCDAYTNWKVPSKKMSKQQRLEAKKTYEIASKRFTILCIMYNIGEGVMWGLCLKIKSLLWCDAHRFSGGSLPKDLDQHLRLVCDLIKMEENGTLVGVKKEVENLFGPVWYDAVMATYPFVTGLIENPPQDARKKLLKERRSRLKARDMTLSYEKKRVLGHEINQEYSKRDESLRKLSEAYNRTLFKSVLLKNVKNIIPGDVIKKVRDLIQKHGFLILFDWDETLSVGRKVRDTLFKYTCVLTARDSSNPIDHPGTTIFYAGNWWIKFMPSHLGSVGGAVMKAALLHIINCDMGEVGYLVDNSNLVEKACKFFSGPEDHSYCVKIPKNGGSTQQFVDAIAEAVGKSKDRMPDTSETRRNILSSMKSLRYLDTPSAELFMKSMVEFLKAEANREVDKERLLSHLKDVLQFLTENLGLKISYDLSGLPSSMGRKIHITGNSGCGKSWLSDVIGDLLKGHNTSFVIIQTDDFRGNHSSFKCLKWAKACFVHIKKLSLKSGVMAILPTCRPMKARLVDEKTDLSAKVEDFLNSSSMELALDVGKKFKGDREALKRVLLSIGGHRCASMLMGVLISHTIDGKEEKKTLWECLLLSFPFLGKSGIGSNGVTVDTRGLLTMELNPRNPDLFKKGHITLGYGKGVVWSLIQALHKMGLLDMFCKNPGSNMEENVLNWMDDTRQFKVAFGGILNGYQARFFVKPDGSLLHITERHGDGDYASRFGHFVQVKLGAGKEPNFYNTKTGEEGRASECSNNYKGPDFSLKFVPWIRKGGIRGNKSLQKNRV